MKKAEEQLEKERVMQVLEKATNTPTPKSDGRTSPLKNSGCEGSHRRVRVKEAANRGQLSDHSLELPLSGEEFRACKRNVTDKTYLKLLNLYQSFFCRHRLVLPHALT